MLLELVDFTSFSIITFASLGGCWFDDDGTLSQLSYLLASYAYSSFLSPFGEIYIVIGSHIHVCFLTKSLPCILFVVWKVPYPNVVPLERETEREIACKISNVMGY